MSNLLASLGHMKKKSCLGPHIQYIVTHNHKKKSHNVLSKFTILCWAAFIAILSHMHPTGAGQTPLQASITCNNVQTSYHVVEALSPPCPTLHLQPHFLGNNTTYPVSNCTVSFAFPKCTHTLSIPCCAWPISVWNALFHFCCQANSFFQIKLRYHLPGEAFPDFFLESYFLPPLCFWNSTQTSPIFYAVSPKTEINIF